MFYLHNSYVFYTINIYETRTFLIHKDYSDEFQSENDWIHNIPFVYSNSDNFSHHSFGIFKETHEQDFLIDTFYYDVMESSSIISKFIAPMRNMDENSTMLLYLDLIKTPSVLLNTLLKNAKRCNIYIVVETTNFSPITNAISLEKI